jgi:hypothetical protein
MENSHLGSDGRVYEEMALAVLRDPDKWNGARATASAFERVEFLYGFPDGGCASAYAYAWPLPLVAAVCPQSEQRSIQGLGESGRHGALVCSGLRFFCLGSRFDRVGGFGHSMDGPAAAR